ncbi:MAG: hypothetical protein K0S07_1437 [Chlamydiales bacterium]|jgi:phosphatidate cytidylyltransferase|nr:hypothetical protein [Chlamydiales bacterium]
MQTMWPYLIFTYFAFKLLIGTLFYSFLKSSKYQHLMIFNRLSNLGQRLIISAIAITVFLILIFFSYEPLFTPIFIAAIALVIGTALWEYHQLVLAKGLTPLTRLSLAGSSLYILAAALQSLGWQAPFKEITLSLLGAFSLLSFFKGGKDPILNVSASLFGVFYITVPLAYIISINYLHHPLTDGRLWLLYLLAVTKMTDIGAYFTGKSIGKRALAPMLSPKKTIEGLVGGLLASVLASLAIAFIDQSLHNQLQLPLLKAALLGAGISLLAVIGDLAESLLKRDAGTKDSNQIPGLGGLLDVVDSLIFTAPCLYFFLQIRYF